MGYPHAISRMLAFDHVIRIEPDLTIQEFPLPLVHAPECLIETDDDGQILAAHEEAWIESLATQGWKPVSGYSSQMGYDGPIMHASEFIGEHMGNEIIDNPGLYVVCSVETLDDSEEAAGWVLLRQDTEIPTVRFR